MSILNSLPGIPKVRPMFNVGCLFDIATGVYVKGKNGEMILNGGMGHITSVAGPGNSFKTVIANYLNLSVAERYTGYEISVYDSENSFSYRRIALLANKFEKLSKIDHGSETEANNVVKITQAVDMMGDEYFDYIKTIAKDKEKNKDKNRKVTPFINDHGENITIIRPTGILVDSLSKFGISSLNEKMTDKNSIGDSGNNTLYMKQGIAKKQLIDQAMNMGPRSGLYFTFVAHVGDEFELDPYAPKKHKLTHAKKGSKITGTTKDFEFINDVIYEIFNVTLLNNKERGTGVLYPVASVDREEETTDLLLITIKPTRNKNGTAGISLDLVVSQREGLLPHLTQFHHCHVNEWGFIGNNINYSLALYPDVKLSRTTVRGKIDEDPKLRRALEFTSQILQIKQTWAPLPGDLMCDPDTLFKDLKLLGYDMNVLLSETRGYWVFEEDKKNEKYELSTLDLLRMRAGDYRPEWYEDAVKKYTIRTA